MSVTETAGATTVGCGPNIGELESYGFGVTGCRHGKRAFLRNFIQFSGYEGRESGYHRVKSPLIYIVGADGGEGTPVPIPNTAVKLTCAEDTWLEAARENR